MQGESKRLRTTSMPATFPGAEADSLEALLQPTDETGRFAAPHERSNTASPPAVDTGMSSRIHTSPEQDADSSAGAARPPLPDARVEPVSIEAIVLRGQSVPVETAWTVELPRSHGDFGVDVSLSNGMSVVVNNRQELEDRWFVIAKDAPTRGHLVARFHRQEDGKLWSPALNRLRHAIALLGSPFASDLSTLAVLGLAVVVTLAPAGGFSAADLEEAHPLANYTSVLDRLFDRATLVTTAISARGVRSAASRLLSPMGSERVAGWLEMSAPARGLLEAHANGDAFYRLAGKVSAAFPPRCTYTLVVKPGSAVDDDDGAAGGRGKRRAAVAMLDGHSALYRMQGAWRACVLPPDGAEGDDAEAGISVERFCEAFALMLEASSVMGPLMSLAVKNDEGNLRKLKAARAKLMKGGRAGCATVREVLELEKASGVHKAGAVLADPSAAIALIWMRRSLEFQRSIHERVLADMEASPNDSLGPLARAAYTDHLEQFHSWLLKNTFAVALNGMPTRKEIYQRLAPHLKEPRRRQVVAQEMREHVEVVGQITESLRALFRELDLEDMRKV